jgi:uncharacterized protein (DUF302 family)
MTDIATEYTLTTRTSLSYDDAVAKVRELLPDEGFGVLTEIDVKATLKKKIDVDRSPYIILGACNPTLAHQALEVEPELGSLLPCNVIVYTDEPTGETIVSAIDAARMLSITGRDELGPIADQVREKLGRVIAAIPE